MTTECEYTVPSGYASTMDRLKDQQGWDIQGLIADVSDDLRCGNDVSNGTVLAVIDTLMFSMKDIAELIAHGHAKRISPETIRQAAEIAAMFVRSKEQS